MNLNAEFMREVERRGLSMLDLDPETAKSIAIAIRTPKQKATAAISYVTAVGRDMLGDNYPDDVAADNRALCESGQCGYFTRMADGLPLCLACGCSSDDLMLKWRTRGCKCPLPTPVWPRILARSKSAPTQ